MFLRKSRILKVPLYEETPTNKRQLASFYRIIYLPVINITLNTELKYDTLAIHIPLRVFSHNIMK